jgi:Flp pilus assembly CpaE family ATPase
VSVPIVTAVGDAGFEADLAAGLGRDEHGLRVVGRCVDLADLVTAATAGDARAVVLSADLRRLDRDALDRLRAAGVAVVGLSPARDDSAEQRLRRLGIAGVLAADAPAAEVAAAVHRAISDLSRAPADPPPAPAPTAAPLAVAAELPPPGGAGRVLAVWGPIGSPGRSTIAVNLATEIAATGSSVLLIDIDTYGAAVGQLLAVLDDAPGVAAACRLAETGSLDVQRLAGVALEVRPALRVLTGVARWDRWLELRAAALTTVLSVARSLAAFVVVDCGFCLEPDAAHAYDTAAPRRNGATLAVLEAADVVVGVAAADPVGLARYVRALPECQALAPVELTVVNRLRPGVVGPGDARRQVLAALDRYAAVSAVHVVPEDRAAVDAALAAGRTLLEAAPKSPARAAIRDLARTLSGDANRQPGRRRR